MLVLVTGGAGFIGSHLVETLLAEGHKVRILDNLSTGKRENLPSSNAIEFIKGDIRDSSEVSSCTRGTDAIVHLAAVSSVQASIEDPVATHQSNFIGTLNILEAARANGISRLVYASSAAVYGDPKRLPVSEDLKPDPLSPYAVDKLSSEYYLRYYSSQYNLNTIAFRFFNIYGPRQDPSSPYSGVISIFSERINNDLPVTIFGDGMQTRDFVFVKDLVAILVKSLSHTQFNCQVMNIGTGTEISLLELLAELEAITGKTVRRRHEPRRLGDIIRSCADTTQLKQVFAILPSTSLREGLGTLLMYDKTV